MREREGERGERAWGLANHHTVRLEITSNPSFTTQSVASLMEMTKNRASVRATLHPNDFQVTRSTIKALCMITTQDSLVGCPVQAEDKRSPLKESMLTSREVAKESRVCTPRYQPW